MYVIPVKLLRVRAVNKLWRSLQSPKQLFNNRQGLTDSSFEGLYEALIILIVIQV